MSRRRSFANPFYAIVVVTGVAFVVTALVYVVALVIAESPKDEAANATRGNAVLLFVERHGEMLLLYEVAVLAAAATLAMGLDRWRTGTMPVSLAESEPKTPRDPSSKQSE